MQTIVENIPNSFDFIKCGEILKCNSESYQNPYVLKCFQCKEIYLLLESFIFHMENRCKDTINQYSNDGKSGNCIVNDTTNTTSLEYEGERFDQVAVKEEDTNAMEMDPLVFVKSEIMFDDEDLSTKQNSILPEHHLVKRYNAVGLIEINKTEIFDTTIKNTNENEELLEDINSEEIESGDESEEKLFIMTDQNGNFNNMFRSSTPNQLNLVTLQSSFNNSINQQQNVLCKDVGTFSANQLVSVLQPMFKAQTAEVDGKISALEPMFLRLTNEIHCLRNEVKELKSIKVLQKKKIIPTKPFQNMEEFLQFEKNIQEHADAYSTFEKDLSSVAKSPNFVKNCWRKIFKDELAEKLCWKGTEQKKSVRSLSTAKAIRNAAIEFGQNEDEFIRSTKTFFQFAKSRQQLRSNYKKTTEGDPMPLDKTDSLNSFLHRSNI